MDRKEYLLLENQTSNIANPTAIFPNGGKSLLAVWGDFGGGIVAIEASPDGGSTWIPVKKDGTPAQYTENEIDTGDFFQKGLQFRAVVSGATNPNLNARIF